MDTVIKVRGHYLSPSHTAPNLFHLATFSSFFILSIFKEKYLTYVQESIYPIFTKFGMGVYWVNSLHGIAFGEDSSIAN